MQRALPTVDNAQAHVRNVLAFGCTMLRARGSVTAITRGFASIGPDVILGTQFKGDSSKEQYASLLRALFVLRDVRYYLVLTEAWMTVLPVTALNDSAITPPSLDPNHTEIIQALLMTPNGGLSGYCEFHRDAAGTITTILPPVIDAAFNADVQGRMASLLDGSRVSKEDLASARLLSESLPDNQVCQLQ